MSRTIDPTMLKPYSSTLAEWDLKASVRSQPRRMIQEIEEGCSSFSEALTPTAFHPAIRERGRAAVEELLTRRLFLYLDFTTVLERDFINPTLVDIQAGTYGGMFNVDLRFDAYRIYCDEAFHALQSVDIRQQVSLATGVSAGMTTTPVFARELFQARSSVPASLVPAVNLCFAVVSETLISGVLSAIPADHTVISGVRDSIADHAADERRHHGYFTRVLEHFWPQLGNDERLVLGPMLADFILAFLRPDREAQVCMLRAMGIDRELAEGIFDDVHTFSGSAAAARHAARSTLALFQRVGVLDHEKVREHFHRRQLLVNDQAVPAYR